MTLKWNWGTGIALVYGIFASATLGFATFAMSRDVDLVSPQYYEMSMSYDARKAATERAMPLPFKAAIDAADATGTQVLSVVFPAGARPASGTVTLYRASSVAIDRSMSIEPASVNQSGELRTSLRALAPGPWTLQIAWVSGGQTYYREQRVIVP